MKRGISYDDVIDLLASWAHHEFSLTNSPCPVDIRLNSAGIVMMDNDDCKEHGLTGAETSHFTHVMKAQSLYVSEANDTNSGNVRFVNTDQSTSDVVLMIPSSDMRKNLASCSFTRQKVLWTSS